MVRLVNNYQKGVKIMDKRGAVAPGKIQTAWRIYSNLVEKCKEEGKHLGLGSVPNVVNFILSKYFNEKGDK